MIPRRAIALSLIALVACGRSGEPEVEVDPAADSIAMLAEQLADARARARDRDAVVREIAETTRLLEDIDRELAQVKELRHPMDSMSARMNDPWAARHERLLRKVRGVMALLESSRTRARALEVKDSRREGEADALRQTIASLEAMLKRQEQEILHLGTTLRALQLARDSLEAANARLIGERDAVREVVRNLLDEANAVYYVVGTKEELVRRGVVLEEGSKRFLAFGSRTLVPAPTPDLTAFTRADKRQPIEIPLGAPQYRVVSPHDPALLETPRTESGKPAGTLRVNDPEQFWSSSRHLIIVKG
jgi:hypothetical protein